MFTKMTQKREGRFGILTKLTKGGGGVQEMLTIADIGGRGGLERCSQWLTKGGGGV